MTNSQTSSENYPEDQPKTEILDPEAEKSPRNFNRLIFAVIQEQDVEIASNSLTRAGFSSTHLASSGGFLGRRNSTLLIGLNTGQEEKVSKLLYQSCRTRIEYVSLPLEGTPMPLPTPTPITVGGATIFAFDVEHYEEV